MAILIVDRRDDARERQSPDTRPRLMPAALLALVALAAWTRARPLAGKRENARKAAAEVQPDPVARRLYAKSYAETIRMLREDFQHDPTPAPALLGITREWVMEQEHYGPGDRAALWEHIQKLQAEAKRYPVRPIFTVKHE